MVSEGLVLHPQNELLNAGVRLQFFDGVVLPLHVLFTDENVNLIVARAADPGDFMPVVT